MTPCWHTRALLAAHADQRLSGLLRRYLEFHVSQCSQCRAALEALLLLRDRLQALRHTPTEQLSAERVARLEAEYRRLLKKPDRAPEDP